jgi:hypothetical protein
MADDTNPYDQFDTPKEANPYDQFVQQPAQQVATQTPADNGAQLPSQPESLYNPAEHPYVENLAGAATELAKGIPGMVAAIPGQVYQGAKFAAGGSQERAEVIGEALRQGVPMGVQVAQDLQAPIGSQQFFRGGLQAALFAAPAVGELSGALGLVRAPIPAEVAPEGQAPVVAPLTQTTETPLVSEQALKETTNAIQEPQTGAVLQRQPEETGGAGGERGRVEPGVQRQEPAAQEVVQPTPEVGTKAGEVAPTAETPTAQEQVTPQGQAAPTEFPFSASDADKKTWMQSHGVYNFEDLTPEIQQKIVREFDPHNEISEPQRTQDLISDYSFSKTGEEAPVSIRRQGDRLIATPREIAPVSEGGEGAVTSVQTKEIPGTKFEPVTAEGKALEAPAEPAATTEPATPGEPTGISKAAIGAQQTARELPAIERQKQIDFGTSLDKANEIVTKDPLAPTKLVAELQRNPRALNPEETPLVIRRVQEVQGEFDAATKAVNEVTTPEDLTAAKSRLEAARNDYDQTVDTAQKATSKTGAGLNSLKMLVDEDYSLAKMESRRRAANNGEPLTAAQEKETADLHSKISDLQSRISELETRGATERDFGKALNEAKAGVKQPRFGRDIVKFLGEKEAQARERIIARRGQLNVDVDPGALVDEAIIGASHIAKGLTKFADWSAQMVSDFGERVKPFLSDLYKRSRAYHDAAMKSLKSSGEEQRKPMTDAQRLQARNQGLENIVARKKGLMEGKPITTPLTDTETEILQTELKKVNEQLSDKSQDIDKKVEAQKQKLRTEIAYRKEGLIPAKAERLPVDAELANLRSELSSLKTNKTLVQEILDREAQAQKRAAKAPPPKSKLEQIKTSLAKQTIGYQAKLERGNLTRETPQKTQYDKAAFQMRANLQKLKNQFDKAVAKEDYNNKTPSQKFWDHFVGVERAMKLSGPEVFGKLGVAAAVREILAPAESAFGYGISKILPELTKDTRYGADLKTTLRAELKAKAALFTEGMKDAAQNVKGRQTQLEVISGKRDVRPDFWYNRIGQMHAAIKAPVKRAEFTRSLEVRMENAVKNGEDISHPAVMERLANEAVIDANRAIFQENTTVSKVFSMLDRQSPITGRVSRFLFPVVKIPVNLFKELVNLHVGSPMAAAKIGKAYWNGIESAPALEREAMVRQLAKGSIGGAGLLWGYYNSDKVQKFFKSIPPWFQHTPFAMILNEGSHLKQLQQGGKEAQEGGKELRYMAKTDIPFMYTVTDIGDAINAHDSRPILHWINNMTKSTVVPQAVSQTANYMDKPGTFPSNIAERPTFRIPRNPIEAVKSGIPGLRQQVPTLDQVTAQSKEQRQANAPLKRLERRMTR